MIDRVEAKRSLKQIGADVHAQAADTSRTQTEMVPCGLTLLNDTFICH
jgi:hypothetical protein